MKSLIKLLTQMIIALILYKNDIKQEWIDYKYKRNCKALILYKNDIKQAVEISQKTGLSKSSVNPL